MDTKIWHIVIASIICLFAIFTIIICIDSYNNIDSSEETIPEETQTEEPTEKPTEETQVIEEYVNVWTTSNVEIKESPDLTSETVLYCDWNSEIIVTYIDDDWAKIKYIEYYVERRYLSEQPETFTEYDAPSKNTIKSYMDYRHITLKSSDQYKMQNSIAYTGENGIRMVNGRYCVALGSYYTTTIGQYVDVILENGNVIQGILADCKDDKHTDDKHQIHNDGSVVEFVVDTKLIDSYCKKTGDMSHINGWNSKVVGVIVYDKVENFK